ncbi:hypothetical protein FE257_002565 [Aspergillus nanangensis]|uniref:UspA domain-containing protein n=1 Tax=Aspergillus nanangensis TaxID=2582783 RepID=A0AAD4CT05_ASPNN|nr:hypothetical protein FE257_002565 [Aspergillus nanangensis]
MPSYTRIPSLSTALEQERLELLQDERKEKAATSKRKPSTTTTQGPPPPTPPPPPRKTLDPPAHITSLRTAPPPFPGDLPPRHGSIAGIGVGVTSPSGGRSGPEPSSSSTPVRAVRTSAVAPPPLPKPPPGSTDSASRRGSDPSSNKDHKPRPSIRWDDSVSMSPSAAGHGAARRSMPPQEKSTNRSLPGKNAMAAVMSGLDLRAVGLPSFTRGRDSGRNNTTRGTSLDSRVSAPRFARSSSPKNRWLSPGSRNQPANSTKPVAAVPPAEKSKQASDTESPEKDARPVPARESSDPDVKSAIPADERLEKDKYDSENNLLESSDEESDGSSSSDDEGSPSVEIERGRPKTSNRSSTDSNGLDSATTSSDTQQNGSADSDSKLSSASETVDYHHSSKAGPIPKKPDVHPRTSFDSPSVSVANTPFGSDDEADISDIKRAQKLGVRMSTINNSVNNRSIRTIIRGDYTNFPQEGDGGRHRQRKYMVATDLSEESVYALEWTIGTILRDGDTMFAVYTIYDETAGPTAVQIGEGAKAMEDSAAIVGSQTEETAQKPNNDSATNLPRALLGRLGSGTDSKPGSVDSRALSKAEAERVHAVESISQTCVRLLRKTLLQVRVAVEVIHCKSPRHMITEAIDGLDPTLVIVGARGRSALKGVLLGSFSNYLVMHSSVPVMVARRKLKKHSKNKKTNVRLSNNLATPKKLALAKVD